MPDVGSDAYNKKSRHWVIHYVNLKYTYFRFYILI